MIPTITNKFEKVVISTGNIINNELGRKSCEELIDGLKLTLQQSNDAASENVEATINYEKGQVQRATPELNQKLTENDRSAISIGAKIFLNKNSNVCINEAIETTLDILKVQHVDNVVMAYHPNPVATSSMPTTPTPKSPCSESGGTGGGGGGGGGLNGLQRGWSQRNDESAFKELEELYKSLEQFAKQKKISQLGVADLDAQTLKELHASAEVAPTIAQVNLSACCVVPQALQEFCTNHDIQLLTHGDPELLLPDDDLSNLLPGYTVDWTLRYQVHLRCRGVLIAKGFILSASRLNNA